MRGVDLAVHHEDVRRLARACPVFRRAVADGMDPDDLLARVYESILVRNGGINPWDPARGGSLGTWVTMVVRSVVVNERDKARGHEAADRELERVAGSPVEGGMLAQAYGPAGADEDHQGPEGSIVVRRTPRGSTPVGSGGGAMEAVHVVRRNQRTKRAVAKRVELRVVVPVELADDLRRLAVQDRRTVAFVVRDLIADALKAREAG